MSMFLQFQAKNYLKIKHFYTEIIFWRMESNSTIFPGSRDVY